VAERWRDKLAGWRKRRFEWAAGWERLFHELENTDRVIKDIGHPNLAGDACRNVRSP
jgi:hypothetical protein